MSERITKQLRDAIHNSDLSEYEIAKASGVDPSIVYRFTNGERSLTLRSVDAIADVLKLNLKGES